MIARLVAHRIGSGSSLAAEKHERSSLCYETTSRRREHRTLAIALALLWLVALGGTVATLWAPTARLRSLMQSSGVTLGQRLARP